MKLISWNVNGIRSIQQKGFDQFLAAEKPDLLCLQETKIQDAQLQALPEIPGYARYAHSEAEKKGYSGVATYIANTFQDPITTVGKSFGVKAYEREGRVLITEHPKFLLYNLYFPSGTSGDERQDFKYKFLADFAKHLENLPATQKSKLIICGDFNICHREIDIHHPEEATKRGLTGFLPDERRWMDSFCKLGFVDTFRHINGDTPKSYTWWSFRANSRAKNLGWRIDYFFVSKKLTAAITDARILAKTQGSDHCPIVLQLKL